MSFSAGVMRRLMKELSELQRTPPEGIRIRTNEDNMLDLVGLIEGPEGTPYAGGYFKIHFHFTEEFPTAPPKCRFMTKIFHPNVGPQGEICVNTLKKDWKSSYGVGHILVTIKCLLIYPNPESALDEEAGKLLLENYDSYCQRAKLITSVHATLKVKPVEFQTPATPTADVGATAVGSTPITSSSSPQPSATPSSTSAASPPVPPAKTINNPAPPPPSTAPPPIPHTTSRNKSGSPSPAHVQVVVVNPLKSVASSKDHEHRGERHVSPSPLGTADSNVCSSSINKKNGSSPNGMESLGVHNGAIPGGTKAVKRAATGGASSGAEKRKKALKRL